MLTAIEPTNYQAFFRDPGRDPFGRERERLDTLRSVYHLWRTDAAPLSSQALLEQLANRFDAAVFLSSCGGIHKLHVLHATCKDAYLYKHMKAAREDCQAPSELIVSKSTNLFQEKADQYFHLCA